jgi:NAD-dependent dihydropyrimidine dehydrogenase PreA subunit
VDVCPENCLQLIPLSQLNVSESTTARLAEQCSNDPLTLQHLEPADLNAGEGSVMVKDETICIRCGLCAERCPAHTISMEAFEVLDRDPAETDEEVMKNELV